MKRIILFFSLCLITLASFAQTVLPAAEPETSFLIDLGSFTGIVALVSTLVTQILKVVPVISASKLAKILISCGVGMVVCIIVWLLQLTPLLTGYIWWQVLIYGLAAGLSGCGFYDVIKAIGALFKKSRALWIGPCYKH